MDPTTVQNSAQDSATLAAIIALATLGVRLIEHFTATVVKKYRPSKADAEKVRLDEESLEKINRVSETVSRMSDVMGRVDSDGTPMVYSSRSGMEAMREMIMVIRSISQTQERLAKSLDKLDEKFEQHDRSDALVFSQISGAIERLTKALDDHDRRISAELREISIKLARE